VHRIDERRDDIVRDLHKRIKRAKMNGAAASRSEAVHRRSAEDANLALDEVCHLWTHWSAQLLISSLWREARVDIQILLS
jgi:hypothetical protein